VTAINTIATAGELALTRCLNTTAFVEAVMPDADSTNTIRPIPDFPGYAVGADGSVWCCRGRGGRKGAIDPNAWRQMKPIRVNNGYRHVNLRRDGKSTAYGVHRLVLLSFVGPCPDGMQCRHANGDKADNRLENLCWGSATENAADRVRHGTNAQGCRIANSKLTDADVVEIRRLYAEGGTKRGIARVFGVSQRTIDFVVRRVWWRHVG
jgi:hypothetical protein